MRPEVVLRWIAVFRVLFGIALMANAIPLIDRGYLDQFSGQLNTFAANNPVEPFQWIVYSVVLPQAQFVGSAIIIGQLLCGFSLAIGFLSRLFCGFGAAFAVLMFVAAGHLGWAYQHECILLFTLFLFGLAIDIGQYYGLDGVLFKKFVPIKPVATTKKKATKPKAKKKKAEKLDVIEYEDDYEGFDHDDEDDDFEEDERELVSFNVSKKKSSRG